MPAYLALSCSTGACGPAVALAGARTDCLAPSSPNQALALLSSVAAIAALVAVRIATNSWSCWFCTMRLISSTSALSLLVSWSEGHCTSRSVALRHIASYIASCCISGELCNCAAIPLYQVDTTNECFSSSVKEQSRILFHALSGVGTRQLAYVPSLGQNASDENKGTSVRSAVSHCMHAQRNRGRDQFRIQNRSSHPVAEDGFTPMHGREWSSIVDASFHIPLLSFVELCHDTGTRSGQGSVKHGARFACTAGTKQNHPRRTTQKRILHYSCFTWIVSGFGTLAAASCCTTRSVHS